MRSERGSGTVLVVGACGLLVAVTVVVLVASGLLARGREVATAADQAALAGAGGLARGLDAAGACAVARELAARNGAALTACVVTGPDVAVVAGSGVRLPLVGEPTLSARARAGPDRRTP